MSSRVPVIFLDLWSDSEVYTILRNNPHAMQIVKNDVEVGLLIPREIMDMQIPALQEFKKRSLNTFDGFYNHVICWRVPSPDIPF